MLVGAACGGGCVGRPDDVRHRGASWPGRRCLLALRPGDSFHAAL